MENIDYIKENFNKNAFMVVFPADGTEESAKILAASIESAVAVAEFIDEEDNNRVKYGVLLDKNRLEVKNEIHDVEENIVL